jgi:hypothetical protein
MSNYTSLLADIPNKLDNQSQELADELDNIIDPAELMLSRDLDVGAFKHQDTSLMSIGNAMITKPAGFVSPRYLKITAPGARGNLDYKTLDWIQEFWPDDTETGTPAYYAEYDDDRLIVAPTPDASLTYEIGFRRRLPALSNSNASNWLTENAYDALCAACLMIGAAFLKDPEQAQLWKGHYDALVGQINREHQRTLRDDRRELAKDAENKGD